MHKNIRKSNIKRDKRGFRYRMKTKGGRKIVNARRVGCCAARFATWRNRSRRGP